MYLNMIEFTQSYTYIKLNGKFCSDILYDLNLRFCFIIQNNSIIQSDSIAGENNGHNLVPISLSAFQMRLMEIRNAVS